MTTPTVFIVTGERLEGSLSLHTVVLLFHEQSSCDVTASIHFSFLLFVVQVLSGSASRVTPGSWILVSSRSSDVVDTFSPGFHCPGHLDPLPSFGLVHEGGTVLCRTSRPDRVLTDDGLVDGSTCDPSL